MRRLLFVVLIALMISLPASAYNYTIGSYGYDFGQQFTATAAGSSGTLSGYQVAVNLSNSTGVSTATKLYTNGTTRVDWTDIVFTDGSDNLLNFWIENNTATATDAYAYVRVPTISTGGTTIRAYYGNASQLVSGMNGYSTYGRPIPSVTVSIQNSTHSESYASTTNNAGGYYADASTSAVFTSGRLYNIFGSKSGYNTSQIYQKVVV